MEIIKSGDKLGGEERRQMILRIISEAGKPVSGSTLAEALGVSRQVIVQDIALLRANGERIDSTPKGYITVSSFGFSRVFKVKHTDEQAREELTIIVDFGAVVKDVFVYHRVYGIVRAQMNIRSRYDVDRYISDMNSGKSTLLKNITSNYHYHTVLADSREILDLIESRLREAGMLAELRDYEPVKFGDEVQ